MQPLARSELYSLEHYAGTRAAFRARAIEHRRRRRLAVGPNVTLHFEDRLTIQYQIQEMLRVERLFEAAAIDAELATYNPLIPDGSNFKATLMIEFPDVAERQRALARLLGIEHRVWVRVAGHGAVYAIADEDLARATAAKTSAVHFLRFELKPAMVTAARAGAALAVGIDQPHYTHRVDPLADAQRAALAADLD